MANAKHLEILGSGYQEWNDWRETSIETPDLSRIDLSGANLGRYNLKNANLFSSKLIGCDLSGPDSTGFGAFGFQGLNLGGANLSGANLIEADFTEANLTHAVIRDATFRYAKFTRANLTRALITGELGGIHLEDAKLIQANLGGSWTIDAWMNGADFTGANLNGVVLERGHLEKCNFNGAQLRGANLTDADLANANLSLADLEGAIMVKTNITGAIFNGSYIYGISTWDLRGIPLEQNDLTITPKHVAAPIKVDNLKVAQFIYLILNNQEVRDVIDTIGNKAVLILGRFTKERKFILDALKAELRKRNLIPILFDFEKPAYRDLTETVSTLAHLSKFVIADITDAKSIPQELKAIIPNLPSLPIQPIILEDEHEYSMFIDFAGYLSVLPPFKYQNIEHLLSSLEERIILPAINKAKEIDDRRKLFEKEILRSNST